MKTTFKQYLLEAKVKMPKARSEKDLFASIEKGHFTKDGSDLKIEVDFRCNHKGLISLIGCPKIVGDYFHCEHNHLTSLEGCPPIIHGVFYCNNNQLSSFKGGPKSVGWDLNCFDNTLTSLEGAPQTIGGSFHCQDNHLTSLESIHMHIHEISEVAVFTGNPIKSHVLGLLKIKKLKGVRLDNEEVQGIVNKYLRGTTGKDPSLRDIVDCQEELMDNDLEDYALL